MTTLQALATRDIVIQKGAERSILGVNIMVTKIKEGVSVRRPATERLNQHGNFSEAGKRGVRLVTVDGIFWADTEVDAALAKDKLTALLADGEIGRLVMVNVLGSRWANCYLFGTPDVALATDFDGDFSFDFECPDPRWYGEERTLTTGIQKSGGGLFFPFGGPISGAGTGEGYGIAHFGAEGSPGTVTWTNSGSADVSPIFEVTDAVGFTITEIETQRRIVYVGTVLPGQTVEIDTNDATVNINGTDDRSSEIALAQWPVIPGNTTRTYMLESITETASLEMRVAPAWW